MRWCSQITLNGTTLQWPLSLSACAEFAHVTLHVCTLLCEVAHYILTFKVQLQSNPHTILNSLKKVGISWIYHVIIYKTFKECTAFLVQISVCKLTARCDFAIIQERQLQGNTGEFLQGWVIHKEIWYQCKLHFNMFIRSCVYQSSAGSLWSALALMLALFFTIVLSVLLGMLYAATTPDFSPFGCVITSLAGKSQVFSVLPQP